LILQEVNPEAVCKPEHPTPNAQHRTLNCGTPSAANYRNTAIQYRRVVVVLLLVILILLLIPRRCGSEKDQIKSKSKIKSKKKPVEDGCAAKARIHVIAGCPRIEMRDRLLKSGMTVLRLSFGSYVRLAGPINQRSEQTSPADAVIVATATTPDSGLWLRRLKASLLIRCWTFDVECWMFVFLPCSTSGSPRPAA